jgi:acyl-CoA hydrolase
VKSVSIHDVLASFRPGQRVFFQGGPGECLHLHDALRDNPGVAAGVEFWSCLIPGINRHDYGSLPGDVRLTTFMASPTLEPAIASGRVQVNAMPYSQIGETLGNTDFDAAILHVSPPDRRGLCSFGVACDTPGIVAPRARRRIAFVNSRMPFLPGAETIAAEQIDLAIEIDAPLIAPLPAPTSAKNVILDAIGRTAAALIPDDSIIQSGIGDTPAAIVAALRFHRGLRVHSGIITPEYQALAEAGALDGAPGNVTGVAWGGPSFYEWLKQSGFTLASIRATHAHGVLAALPRFVSIGSAIEVDLAGNLNLEWRMSRWISSVGGASDFMRGAAAAADGLSIIALQAASGGASRIVPTIASPTIPGELADAIVTEHGVARLKGLSPRERAEALIAIAAPEHQPFLSRAAETILPA